MIKPGVELHPLQHLPRIGLDFRPIAAADQSRHHRVFQRREFRQKMMELKDKADVSIAEFRKLRGTPFNNIPIFKEHFTARRRIQSAE